jgi:hypothetical protein
MSNGRKFDGRRWLGRNSPRKGIRASANSAVATCAVDDYGQPLSLYKRRVIKTIDVMHN